MPGAPSWTPIWTERLRKLVRWSMNSVDTLLIIHTRRLISYELVPHHHY